VLQSRLRGCLDARRDGEELLRDALGAKKLKELRRQRHRLAEHGAVHFEVARSPEAAAAALEIFLRLEASGWKAKRGTALIQDDGDAAFVRGAVPALAETGQSEIVTPRDEADQCRILSGVFEGQTLGTPICLWVKNEDARSEAYGEMKDKYRPSHADYTYFAKYGIRAWQGGGRASARETIGRVAAGAVAKKVLREQFGVEILAYVKQVQKIVGEVDPEKVKLSEVEANIVRCPDPKAADAMIELIEQMRAEGNTVGGIVEGIARGVPAGWGEPVFDKLEADLAKAMLSLPACKGFESGDGFAGILLTGREHNDPIRSDYYAGMGVLARKA